MKDWLIRKRVLRRSSVAAGLAALSALALTTSATAFPTPSGQVTAITVSGSSNFAKGGTVSCSDPTSNVLCRIDFGFESEQVTSSTTSVDTATPNTYSDATTLTGASIPSGTCVDSWLVHFDNGSAAAAVENGSIKFQMPILGVDALASSLDSGDATFGHAGASYPTGNAQRGFELANAGASNTSGNPDTFTIEADQKTLDLHTDVGASDGDVDQLRVFTGCIPTTLGVGVKPKKIVWTASGETETLTASVSQNGLDNGPISGGVTWSIDGTAVTTSDLVDSTTVPGLATAKAKVHMPATLLPGYHHITLSFNGDVPEYGANSITKVFLIRDPNSIN